MDYIKLSRKLMDWEWYSNINTCRLFIHMLLKANWKDGKFEGKVIPRGSFVSSIGTLAKETSLTNDEVRTALKHLISTKEIAKQSYSKYTVFSVNNYAEYQDVPKQIPDQVTSSSHSIPTLFPTIEEKKEVKKGKNNNNIFVPPTVQEVAKYCQERRNNVGAEAFVDFYTANGWVQGKGKPIKDWKAAVRTWEKNSKPKTEPKKNSFNQFEQNSYDFDSLEKELLSN